jgi:signal transduction histidine kinase
MLGYNRREEQTGQQCDMLPEELNPRSAETGQRLAAGEQPIAHALSGHSTVREVIVRHRETGEDRIIRYAAAPITVDNAVVGAVAIGTDVTERRAAESEEKRRAAFEQQLIGIVSHDLRNPLHTIRLSATHGLRSVSEAGQRRVLERIVLASNRAGRMIDDLLDFTSVRFGGGLGVQRKPVNLHVLVAQVVDEMVATRPERRVATEVSGDGGGLWDEDRLVQVLQNLVGNALQHTSEDVAVRVRTRGDAERVILDVHNGGPPIASDDLPSLFEPFQRGRGARSGAGRSMGLGLYITCHIVQAHGGTVTVRSTSEEGTTFTVTLPRHEKGAV